MRTLVIECSSDNCSVALFSENELIASQAKMLGRGHAERLVPMIASLPDKGQAQRVAVSLGPGSFTGVRIGLAAARGLGLAWQAEVCGYPTLALVAAMARKSVGTAPVSVAMHGGHGQWFVQDFAEDGLPESNLQSLAPDEAMHKATAGLVAGNRAEDLVKMRKTGDASPLWPDAVGFGNIPQALLTPDLSPIYGRGPDAKKPTTKANTTNK